MPRESLAMQVSIVVNLESEEKGSDVHGAWDTHLIVCLACSSFLLFYSVCCTIAFRLVQGKP